MSTDPTPLDPTYPTDRLRRAGEVEDGPRDLEMELRGRVIPEAARIKIEEAQALFGEPGTPIRQDIRLKLWDCLVMAKSFLGEDGPRYTTCEHGQSPNACEECDAILSASPSVPVTYHSAKVVEDGPRPGGGEAKTPWGDAASGWDSNQAAQALSNRLWEADSLIRANIGFLAAEADLIGIPASKRAWLWQAKDYVKKREQDEKATERPAPVASPVPPVTPAGEKP